MKTLSTLFTATLLMVLSACGGGSSSAPATNSPAQGMWQGTSSANSTITIFVLGDGSYYIIHSPPNNPSSIDGFIQGTGAATASPGTFTSSDMKDFIFGTTTPLSATMSANYTAKQSFNGTVTVGSGSLTFTTTYSSAYETVPTLGAIAGTYTGTAVVVSVGNGASILTVSSAGALSDDGGNCQLTGSVSSRSEGNVYNFTASFPSTCPNTAVAGKTFTGMAYFNAATKGLYVMAPNAARNDGVFYIGSKP